MKKKTLFICLLSLMYTLGAMAQVTLTIPTVQAPTTGAAVTMPINVSNFTNVGAITLKVTYDTSVVTYVGIANAPTGVTFTVGSGTPGVINLGWFDATGSTPISITSGKLVDLNFTYKKGTSTIGFTASACDIANGSGASITGIVYTNGSLLSSTTTTITIPNVPTPAAGGTVSVPINVANFTNVGAITLKVTYDTASVTYIGTANAPTGVTFTVGSGTPGVINLGWFDATGNTPLNITSGKLVDLNFTYKKGTGAFGFTT
ncbi:MAG: cohesin domain-containing protein, partial [Bacteroidota bacterium]